MEKPILTLKQHRLAQGLTIRDLVAKVRGEPPTGSLSGATIVSIEAGNPARVATYKKLAEALGVDLMQIREYRDMVFKG